MSNVIPFKRRGEESSPPSPEEERLFEIFRGSLISRTTRKPCTDEEVRAFMRRLAGRVEQGLSERGYRPRR